MKKYNVKNIPLPIRPGDKVYFILDDDTVEEDTATSVGINEDGRLLVMCDGSEYEVGTEDRLFLSETDAHRYLEDPSSITVDYGIIEDYRSLDLPYYPGTTFFYCDPDWLDGRWEVFEEYYTYVFFDADGSVRVGDEDSECTVIGKEVDPCFDTLRKAQAYMRKNPIEERER